MVWAVLDIQDVKIASLVVFSSFLTHDLTQHCLIIKGPLHSPICTLKKKVRGREGVEHILKHNKHLYTPMFKNTILYIYLYMRCKPDIDLYREV